MGVWIECNECPFATNSPKQAGVHVTETGHTVHGEED